MDDHIDAVVDVAAPIKVLVVSGDERPPPASPPPRPRLRPQGPAGHGRLRSEADYLQVALAPYKAAKRKTGDLSTVDVVTADAWDGPTVQLAARWRPGRTPRRRSLASYQVVILANVERSNAARPRAVEQFAYDGGGLLIAPGILSRPQEYNDYLYRSGRGSSPRRCGSRRRTTARRRRRFPAVTRPTRSSPSSAAGRTRSCQRSSGGTSPMDRQPAVGRVLASYASGDPFLARVRRQARRPGRGRVLLMTTALDADWTTLPLTNFYLPFVQSAVRYLAAMPVRKSELKPGEPIDVQLDDPGTGRGRCRCVTPDSGERPFEPAPRPTRRRPVHRDRAARPVPRPRHRTRAGRPYSLSSWSDGPPDESDPRPLDDGAVAVAPTEARRQRIDTAEAPLAASAVVRPNDARCGRGCSAGCSCCARGVGPGPPLRRASRRRGRRGRVRRRRRDRHPACRSGGGCGRRDERWHADCNDVFFRSDSFSARPSRCCGGHRHCCCRWPRVAAAARGGGGVAVPGASAAGGAAVAVAAARAAGGGAGGARGVAGAARDAAGDLAERARGDPRAGGQQQEHGRRGRRARRGGADRAGRRAGHAPRRGPVPRARRS